MRGAALREILLIGVCYVGFSLVRNLADPSPVLDAVRNGWQVVRLEGLLGLDLEWNVQREIGGRLSGFLTFLTYFYAVGLWLGLGLAAVVLFWKRQGAYRRLRGVFLVTLAGAAVGYVVYPLAPPRFLPGFGMLDTVREMGLDPSASSDFVLSYNRYAAMPSLHYAWALLVTVACFQVRWWWARAFGVGFQGLMLVAIIATANHYVVDAIGGVLLLVIAFAVLKAAEGAWPVIGWALKACVSDGRAWTPVFARLLSGESLGVGAGWGRPAMAEAGSRAPDGGVEEGVGAEAAAMRLRARSLGSERWVGLFV